MSKRKGVSAEEKRTRMLQLFYEKKTFFQLKELEKIAPQEKGIIVNSVKEVVDSLVDAGKVDTAKIGTSVYFWAFPSKAKNVRKRKLEDVTNKYEESAKRLKSTTKELEGNQMSEEEVKERNSLQDKIMDLQIERDLLKKKLDNYNAPEVLEKMREKTKEIIIAANRWTDNVFSIKQWCKNKFFIEDKVFDKQFEIPENFDYVE